MGLYQYLLKYKYIQLSKDVEDDSIIDTTIDFLPLITIFIIIIILIIIFLSLRK